MNNEHIVWKLAKERQADALREADQHRLLKEAGLIMPIRLSKKLALVLIGLVPLALVLRQLVV